MTIKTASWFTRMPADHARIGISRSTPRGQLAGFRLYRRLAPGPWFNSVGLEEYRERYRAEVLDRLDPHQVAAELEEIAAGRVAVLLCFCRPGAFCHRRLAADWLCEGLCEGLGVSVPEFVHEDRHPLLPQLE